MMLAATIRKRFRAALIDEFQDTDPLQEEIFHRIFGGGESWLFLIGDPKQAIFGFRGADVFSYLRAAQRAERRFTLQTNYRSSTALVAATNHIFSRERARIRDRWHRVSRGPGFRDPRYRGLPGARGERADAHLGMARGGKESRMRVADAVAAEIARILHGAGSLGDARSSPADIAVLTRTKNQAQEMQVALRSLAYRA